MASVDASSCRLSLKLCLFSIIFAEPVKNGFGHIDKTVYFCYDVKSESETMLSRYCFVLLQMLEYGER